MAQQLPGALKVAHVIGYEAVVTGATCTDLSGLLVGFLFVFDRMN